MGAVEDPHEPPFFRFEVAGGVAGGVSFDRAHRLELDEELRAGRLAWQLDPVEPVLALTLRALPHDIAGTWRSATGLRHAVVTIKEETGGLYSVEYSSGGCLGYWNLTRRARYVEGELAFDFPVREYPAEDFQRFFVVLFGGIEHLVPSTKVARYVSLLSSEKGPAEALRLYSAFLPRREEP